MTMLEFRKLYPGYIDGILIIKRTELSIDKPWVNRGRVVK